MVSGYPLKYISRRVFTKMVKFYLANKTINNRLNDTTLDTTTIRSKIAKCHKIDSKNASFVTENIFDCLEYFN